MNKRLLGGLLAAGIIGGGVYGFAATLEPTSDNLGAGGDAVETCDAAVTTSYKTAYVGGDYKVTEVLIEGIADACLNHVAGATLSGTSGAVGDAQAEMGTLVGTTTDAKSFTLTIDEQPLASAVTGVDVVFHNGSSTSTED